MSKIAAALAAALLCAGSAPATHEQRPRQLVIDGDTMPQKLSEFGLFRPHASRMIDAVIPYDLKTPLFSDYAEKRRGIWMPEGTEAIVGDGGRIAFPIGTVLVKSFAWADHEDGRPVETRLLIHRARGWIALPYIWDADGRDATLALGGRRIAVTTKGPDGAWRKFSYAVPNRNQCTECHGQGGALVPIGPKLANLPGDAASKLLARMKIDRAGGALTGMPRWDAPAAAPLAARARAYLDVNCAHCHNPEGSASNSGLFLRWEDDAAGVNYGIGKRPVAAGRGSGGMEFAILPGQPEKSFLVHRFESIEPGVAMPEVGRAIVHVEAAALLRQWIAQMSNDGHEARP